MTLTPAYGRDYKSAKSAIADFNIGKDFIIADIFHPYSGKPANRSDLPEGSTVQIRFDGLRKITVAKV